MERKPAGEFTFPIKLRCPSPAALIAEPSLEACLARALSRAFERAHALLPAPVASGGVLLQPPYLAGGSLSAADETVLLTRVRRAIEATGVGVGIEAARREPQATRAHELLSRNPRSEPKSGERQKRLEGPLPDWLVLKAINFQAPVGSFLDFVESLASSHSLPDKVLYIDQYQDLRWVSLWLVQVNQDNTLIELEEILAGRADQLWRRRSNQILLYGMGTNERIRRELIKMDKNGLVARDMPSLQDHNVAGRISGSGDDTVIHPGGWVLFASMLLPKLSEADFLTYLDEVTVPLPLHALEFLDIGERFEQLFHVSWNDYLSKYGDEPATLQMLPFSTNRRAHFKALLYLLDQRFTNQVIKSSAYFGTLRLLNQITINHLPDAARAQARHLTNEATLKLDDAQREGWWERGWIGAFIYAVIDPIAQESMLSRRQREAETAEQAEPAETPEQLIDRFRLPSLRADIIDNRWLDRLIAYLVQLARRSPAPITYVRKVLDQLGSAGFVTFAKSAASGDTLDLLARSPGGRLLLEQLFDELTAGTPGKSEQELAERVLEARVRARSIEVVARRVASARWIFPFALPGITVYNDSPIQADRLADGRIRVKVHPRVHHTFPEAETLPYEAFTGNGLVLDADEWIFVKLYDEGGIVVPKPALFLVQLSHMAHASTQHKIGSVVLTVAPLGVFGLGGLLGVAGGSRVLYWLDIAATAILALGTVVDEQRGWIIKTFGEDGRTFIKWVGVAQTLAGLYGMGRLAFSAPHVIKNLGNSWRSWRASRTFWKLAGEDLRRAGEISQRTEQFLNSAYEAAAALQKAGGAGADAAATLTPAEVPAEPPAEPPASELPPVPETAKGLKPELVEALAKNKRAADALTLCKSPCTPEFATPAQVERVEKLLAETERRGLQIDKTRLREYFHRPTNEMELTQAIDDFAQAMRKAKPSGAVSEADAIMDEAELLQTPSLSGHWVHPQQSLPESLEAAREAGVPDLVTGDAWVMTRADFPEAVPDRPIPQGIPAPPARPLYGPLPGRPVSRSQVQNREVQADIQLMQDALEGSGAQIVELRIDQTQTSRPGQRAGTNRPDVQLAILHAEKGGRRIYIEYDRAPPTRALDHARRIIANDPDAIVVLKVVDFE